MTQIKNLKICNNKNLSRSKNFDFQYLIQSTNIDFNVIATSETRIKNKSSVVDINLCTTAISSV